MSLGRYQLNPGLNYFIVRNPKTALWIIVGAMTAIDAKHTASVFFANQGENYSVQELEAQHVAGGILYAISVHSQAALDSSPLVTPPIEGIPSSCNSGGCGQ